MFRNCAQAGQRCSQLFLFTNILSYEVLFFAILGPLLSVTLSLMAYLAVSLCVILRIINRQL